VSSHTSTCSVAKENLNLRPTFLDVTLGKGEHLHLAQREGRREESRLGYCPGKRDFVRAPCVEPAPSSKERDGYTQHASIQKRSKLYAAVCTTQRRVRSGVLDAATGQAICPQLSRRLETVKRAGSERTHSSYDERFEDRVRGLCGECAVTCSRVDRGAETRPLYTR
jgi:hypothetical protein